MLGKTPKYHQVNVFQTPLRNFINIEHELVKLAETINWDAVEVIILPKIHTTGQT
jgi:hypothetical protein